MNKTDPFGKAQSPSEMMTDDVVEDAPSSMEEPIQVEHVGALLCATRMRLGGDLQEIAKTLRIRYGYLVAIEDGRHEDLPGTAYSVGFVRAYADYLGLNGDEVVRRLHEESSGTVKTPRYEFPSPSGESGLPNGGLLAIAVGLGMMVYGAWYTMSSAERTPVDLIQEVPSRLAVLLDEEPSNEIAANSPNQFEVADSAPASNTNPDSDTNEVVEALSAASGGDAVEDPESEQAVIASALETDQAPISSEGLQSSAVEGTLDSEVASEVSSVVVAGDEEVQPPAVEVLASESDLDEAIAPVQEFEVEVEQVARIEEEAPTPSDEQPIGSEPDAEDMVVAVLPEQPSADLNSEQGNTASVEVSDETPIVQAEQSPPADTPATISQETASILVDEVTEAPEETVATLAVPDPTAPNEVDGQDNQTDQASEESVEPESSEGLAIELRAKSDSWIQVRDGDDLLLTRLLRQGEVYTVPERSGLTLMTGNAGGLEVFVDGELMPPLGDVGVVRRGVPLSAERLRSGIEPG